MVHSVEILPELDTPAFPRAPRWWCRPWPSWPPTSSSVHGQNGLARLVGRPSDDRIAHAFRGRNCRRGSRRPSCPVISRVRTPLAVRSSSLLEDALDHPFAGVYSTKMIPNNQAEADTRFQRLVEAIGSSTHRPTSRRPRDYSRGRARPSPRRDGRDHPGSGRQPARGPVLPGWPAWPGPSTTTPAAAKPTDGVVNLALGLGAPDRRRRTVAGATPRPCPRRRRPSTNVGDLLRNTQTTFWAVNMGTPPPPDPMG